MRAQRRSRGETVPWRERPTLREEEVADLIGISQRQVGRMAEKGELELRRVGSIRLITTQSLIAWELGSEVAPAILDSETIHVRSEIRRAAANWSKGVR
jgi:excisionase family DNA binding protein